MESRPVDPVKPVRTGSTGNTAGAAERVELVERLLHGCRGGDREAFDRLFDLLYDELRVIARRHVRELGDAGQTLNTTALVHESYLKLAAGAEPRWRQRVQFFAVASRAMRHILVDYARRRRAEKRGGGLVHVTLHDETVATENRTAELLELDDGLSRLAAKLPRLESVVECRFFGGMSVEETAEALGVSPRTVERDWTRARAYLFQMMSADSTAAGPMTGRRRR
jgi:RNA polymerase sigma-70 factor, ECF subfamily